MSLKVGDNVYHKLFYTGMPWESKLINGVVTGLSKSGERAYVEWNDENGDVFQTARHPVENLKKRRKNVKGAKGTCKAHTSV